MPRDTTFREERPAPSDRNAVSRPLWPIYLHARSHDYHHGPLRARPRHSCPPVSQRVSAGPGFSSRCQCVTLFSPSQCATLSSAIFASIHACPVPYATTTLQCHCRWPSMPSYSLQRCGSFRGSNPKLVVAPPQPPLVLPCCSFGPVLGEHRSTPQADPS